VKPKLYLAGPMTGLPKLNFPEFFRVEGLLVHDWFVVNPARMAVEFWKINEIIPSLDKWESCPEFEKPTVPESVYLKTDIRMLTICNALALLPGYENSSGANKEIIVARYCGIPVCDVVFDEQGRAFVVPWESVQ